MFLFLSAIAFAFLSTALGSSEMVQLARDLFSLQNEARIDPSGFVSRLRDEALFDAADALENASPRACSAFTRSNGLDQAALEHSDVLAQTGAQSHTVGTSTFFGRIGMPLLLLFMHSFIRKVWVMVYHYWGKYRVWSRYGLYCPGWAYQLSWPSGKHIQLRLYTRWYCMPGRSSPFPVRSSILIKNVGLHAPLHSREDSIPSFR